MPAIRPTREEDLEQLADLLDGIFRRPRGITDQSMLTDFPLVFTPANLRNGRVVFEDGRLVAHAALWRREAVIDGDRLVVGVLVAVATHTEYRNRGYAAEAVKSLQAQMHEEDYDLGLLWTAVPDFYLKLGWELAEPRGKMVTLPTRKRYDAPPVSIEIVRFDPRQHAVAVHALHEREAVRFLRSEEESRALLALPKTQTWIAARAGRVAGYLVHATGCNKRGLIEYGGDLDAVASLACHVASQESHAGELPLLTYHVRPDLLEWATQHDLPLAPLNSSKGFGHEMILRIRRDRMQPQHCSRLFAWGLDHA
jgi:N-acetylglutamate synthase-like GNAT family acetyltransferase